MEDLHKDTRAGSGPSLIHDVLDVLLDRQLANGDRIGNLLIRPAFQKMFDDFGLAICEMKSFLGLLEREVLAGGDLFENDEHPRVVKPSELRQSNTREKDRVLFALDYPAKLELFPILRVAADFHQRHNFARKILNT